MNKCFRKDNASVHKATSIYKRITRLSKIRDLNIRRKYMFNNLLYKRFSMGTVMFLTIILYTSALFAGDATLSWNPPTTNENNTPLTDLAGFKVYYGAVPGNYSTSIDAGNVTTYQVNNLTDGLTYYFVTTAYDTSGNESSYSNEVSKYMTPSGTFLPDITVIESVPPANDLQMPFGNIAAGSSSNKIVTVTNNGNSDLVMDSIAQINPLANPFSIVSDNCSSQTLSPASSCTLTVRFSPSSSATFSDSFDIPSNDPDENPVAINVSGTGNTTTLPDITVTDSVAPADNLHIPFGDITIGSSSDQTVTVTNDGNADLVIGSIAQSNPLLESYSIENDYCSGQTLSPGSNCTVTVRFSPTRAITFNGDFDIPSNDSDENTIIVNTTGTGTATTAPDITVTDSSGTPDNQWIWFGNITAGNSSDHTVTITNDGNADLVIGSIAQINPLANPLSTQNDYCSGQTLSPASSCTLTVRFSPSSAGTFNDSFNIPSNDSDENSITVTVDGTGITPAVPNITVTDSVGSATDLQIPFGDITEGSSSDQSVTVTNSGNADLVIGNIAQNNLLTLPFSKLNDGCSGETLSPLSSCTITVRFAPATIGVFNNSFDIPSNDPDENTVIITANGTGLSSITNNPPSNPHTVFPAHNQKGLGKAVEFKWKKSSDPDADTVVYDLYVCEDSALTIGCQSITHNIAFLVNDNVYYAGLNNYGTGLFLFIAVSALTGIIISRNRKVLRIIAGILIIGTLLTACGAGELGVSGGLLTNGSTPSSNNDELSYTISGLNSGTIYYWKVVAKDTSGGETESTISSFETE
jgi:carbon monoxide dehydrogenase subunit G